MTYMDVQLWLAEPYLYRRQGEYPWTWVVNGLTAITELEYIAY